MTGRLDGKTAIVIGAARGIGEGIAARFIEEGARVVIGDTEVEAGEATAERLGARFVETDITRPADAEAHRRRGARRLTAGSTSWSRMPASIRGR